MAVLVATVDGYHVLTSSGEHHVALQGHRRRGAEPRAFRHLDRGRRRSRDLAARRRRPMARAGKQRPRSRVPRDRGRCRVRGHRRPAHAEARRRARRRSRARAARRFRSGSRARSVAPGRQLVAGAVTERDRRGFAARQHPRGRHRALRRWRRVVATDDRRRRRRARGEGATRRRARSPMAAAAVGLCVSRDGGRHWEIVDDGLHATYACAVAFDGDDVLVSVSDGPFARRSAIYRGRRQIGRESQLERVARRAARMARGQRRHPLPGCGCGPDGARRRVGCRLGHVPPTAVAGASPPTGPAERERRRRGVKST